MKLLDLLKDPMQRDLGRIAGALEQLVDLKRLEIGLDPIGPLLDAQARVAQAARGSEAPEPSYSPTQIEALRSFGRDQGFSGNFELDEDPIGFASRHGWIDRGGVIQVDLGPYVTEAVL